MTTLTRLREVLQNDSGGSYRIYRTAAGFRILAAIRSSLRVHQQPRI